ncbi:chloramphenicol phosphotransferase CPT family protein [Devosia lacusdianchii]|uniref:chloramphenicol phosphotransferase CPT family protein n=1 Tax=Devosia lacusdianchii TaxID=2917991 RepID=UPI001F069634|nr:AAA family ATPase [Devosia sp. JXJ CY 41]
MADGRIILLNGTSSAGKTTLSHALRAQLAEPFCLYASDQLADAGFRPPAPHQRHAGRERFFDGFHRSIPAFAAAGNDVIIEHIVEQRTWADQLAALIGHLDVFWIGVHAPLAVLEQRERARGNRQTGEAAYHLKTHDYCRYDLEADTTSAPIEQIAADVAAAWRMRAAR